MLTMRPQKKFVFSLVAVKKAYDILDEGKPVAVVAYLKDKGGEITIDAKQYPIVRSGGPSSEMLGQLIIRKVMGRKQIPATYALNDSEGRQLFLAEHSKEGFAITRGTETFRFRKPKKSKSYQLFRDGDDQPLLSDAGRSPSSEFDLPFQAFLFSLVIALLEEDVGDAIPSSF